MMKETGAMLMAVVMGLLPAVDMVTQQYWDYIIMGAGPGGLQMGYFLHQANRDYVIFEKNNISGSFFARYPRHGKLISINKCHTGKTNKEFNLRHDWNSLLSHDDKLLFRHYSKDFFPQKDVMLRYLNDYTRKLHLNVIYNTEIGNITQHWNESFSNYGYSMKDQEGNVYSCRTLLVATGMWKPNIPKTEGIHHAVGYEDVSINPHHFDGKNVLIFGHGNSAFETADVIYGHANYVHVVGRSRVRLSWETHYVGDVRGINNGLLDTYQLKSLDGLVEGHLGSSMLQKKGDQYYFSGGLSSIDNFALRGPYDTVVRCLGFTFDDSIFTNLTNPMRGHGKLEKYPVVGYDYQAEGLPNMYMLGAVSHHIDHRKSAGGFIHGFRYTAEAVHHILEWRNHQVAWPSVRVHLTNLLSHIIKRINEASGIYQMFKILGDVIILPEDDNDEYIYLEEFPIYLLHSIATTAGHKAKRVIVMAMTYGENYSGPGKDVFRENRARGFAGEAHKSNFLHPVLYYYDKLPTVYEMLGVKQKHFILPRPAALHHVLEDFLTLWTGPITHVLPLRHFIENCTQHDLRDFYAKDCLQMALTHRTLPLSCQQEWSKGQGLVPMVTGLDARQRLYTAAYS